LGAKADGNWGLTMTGQDIYRKLMDLDLILQDTDKMVALRVFLDTVSDDIPGLIKLANEVDAITARIETLVAVAERR
jgi:hypothetical protein